MTSTACRASLGTLGSWSSVHPPCSPSSRARPPRSVSSTHCPPRDAYSRFGKGRDPAALEFGDWLAYALASALGEPLMYLGQ